MQKELIKEVVINIVGKSAEPIVDLLEGKRYVNEFIIAKKLGLTINQTRNILYKLSDFGLVSSMRKKDKKKGWYTYFWRFELTKILEFLKSTLEKKISSIHSQINSRETKQFYLCDRCKVEFNEENALLMDFTCNECGGVFTLKDNSRVLKELYKNLLKFQKEMSIVEGEILREKEKIDKQRTKDSAKKQLETLKKRKEKRLANKKAKLKLLRKQVLLKSKKLNKKTRKVKTKRGSEKRINVHLIKKRKLNKVKHRSKR